MALESDRNKQLKLAKQGLDSALINNPGFDDAFLNEIKYIFYKTHDEDIKMNISDDKRTVSLTSFSPIVDCAIPEFRGANTAYLNSKIYLNDDDNMYVEYSQGLLLDKKDLEAKGYVTSARYNSKFETLYTLTCYDKFGFVYLY